MPLLKHTYYLYHGPLPRSGQLRFGPAPSLSALPALEAFKISHFQFGRLEEDIENEKCGIFGITL